MKLFTSSIIVLILLFTAFTFFSCAGKTNEQTMQNSQLTSSEGKPQTICPVMGGKIDKKFYADYNGKRVYFCCGACNAEFQKDPDGYIKKLENQGVILEQAPQKGNR